MCIEESKYWKQERNYWKQEHTHVQQECTHVQQECKFWKQEYDQQAATPVPEEEIESVSTYNSSVQSWSGSEDEYYMYAMLPCNNATKMKFY